MSAQVSHKRSTGKEGMSAQILIIPHHLVRNEDELFAARCFRDLSCCILGSLRH